MFPCGFRNPDGSSVSSISTEVERTSMRLFSVEKLRRPAWWGFFVSTGLAILLVGSQTVWRARLESNWPTLREERKRDLAELIRIRFNGRVQSQGAMAQEITRDEVIKRAFNEKSSAAVAAGFQKLEAYHQRSGASIDVVDSIGAIVLWSGRSVSRDYRARLEHSASELLISVSQASLHRFLSVGKGAEGSGYFVFVSNPLETNYPVSNRFVSSASFAEGLLRETGLGIRFVTTVSPRDTAGDAVFAVSLMDTHDKVVTKALIPSPTVAAEQGRADRWFDAMICVFAGTALTLLAILGAGIVASNVGGVRRLLSLLLLVWGLRIGLKALSFPAVLIGGFLFDPVVQSSPFYFGLASSLGELLISTVALFLSVLLLLQWVVTWAVGSRGEIPVRKPWRAAVRIVIALLLPFAFQWIVRGYGAAIRSFVFDSTIHYQDPISLFPSLAMTMMHLCILMLTLSLLAALGAAVVVVGRMITAVLPGSSRAARVSIMTFLFLAGYAGYLIINRPPQVPFLVPLLLYALGAVFLFVFESGYDSPFLKRRYGLAGAVVLAVAFATAVGTLNAWIEVKERERVQILAEELLRPADNWLSLVVSESLRSAVGAGVGRLPSENLDSMPSVDLAFSLWAQTLMSKEGYSSAVVVYDRSGKELSRFAVGLTSYEQMELLTDLFQKEEDALLVVDRKVADGTIKYYGQWEHVVDTNSQPLGTVAVLVSASQHALFRGEAPEQLRTSSSGKLEDIVRPVSISEYRNGRLWTTDNPFLFRGMQLTPAIASGLENVAQRFIWSEELVEGHHYDVLYAKDESDSTRVMAVGLASLDVRWHLFNVVKNLFVYVLFLGALVVFMLLRSVWSGHWLRFGFREKLILSFAVLSVLPLVLMAYYDRQLALERLDENITARVSQDLDLIQQRFSTLIQDDSDFSSGVSDDFCEGVASDLGVDFSVFEGSQLKASSRPELYRASILDDRLTGSAYVNTMTLGRGFHRTQEQIGDVSYIVGYRPLMVGGETKGVLAVPALYRQQEIEEELAQRNAFVLGAYAFVVAFVIGLGIVLANRLSRPLRDLSKAAERVGKGDLDIVLQEPSEDEVGDLIRSFNHMTHELRSSREHLARAERELAWKEMAKQVAHEIKNPLTPIKLSIQHLVEAYKQGSKDFGDVLRRVSQTVVEQIDVLTRIASEFSNFARMPERRFERIDLNDLMKETIDLFKEVRGVEFKAQLSPQPAIVVADQDELRRVFINLVRNSVQAMERGGIISIDLSVEHKTCNIRISDTGAGIPDDVQAKVFQPNFSTKTDGMGLGLAIARKVIEDLDGTITLRSKVGSGTIVNVQIPLRHS
jgi:two-component system nitrogen regulation sensor histidine kinase NtrY